MSMSSDIDGSSNAATADFADAGTTFTEFLRQQRLARAYRLLGDPAQKDRNVADLAYAAGFSDLSHFNRAFRRRYGVTPREIRKVC